MSIEEIIRQYGGKQPFSDTVGMLFSNCVDYGGDNGGLISSKKYPELEMSIKALMKKAWEHGQNACVCGKCNFCIERGPDTFDRFIQEFPDFC